MPSKITKENLDTVLSELAKEFRRQSGRKAEAELIIVGGCSLMANYNFRQLTHD